METINADDAFKLCSKAADSWAGYHEVQKNVSRAVMDSDATLEEKIVAAESLILAYYERAMRQNDDFRRISYNEYAAMLLQSCKENIFMQYDEAIYSSLISIYGCRQGLSEGKTYVWAYEDEED